MPKRTTNFSGSKVPSHADVEKNPERSLANLYRITIVDQLDHLENDPALNDDEKLTALYGAFQSLVGVINRLSSRAPAKAPELWEGRDSGRKEDINSFMCRVYGPYRARGMTMAHLSRLDPHGYKAWYGWRKSPANRGADPPLPTRSQANDQALAQPGLNVSLADIAANLPLAIRERIRLYGTASNRRQRLKKAAPK